MNNVAFTYLFLKEDNDWTEDNLLSNRSHFNLLVYKNMWILGSLWIDGDSFVYLGD